MILPFNSLLLSILSAKLKLFLETIKKFGKNIWFTEDLRHIIIIGQYRITHDEWQNIQQEMHKKRKRNIKIKKMVEIKNS